MEYHVVQISSNKMTLKKHTNFIIMLCQFILLEQIKEPLESSHLYTGQLPKPKSPTQTPWYTLLLKHKLTHTYMWTLADHGSVHSQYSLSLLHLCNANSPIHSPPIDTVLHSFTHYNSLRAGFPACNSLAPYHTTLRCTHGCTHAQTHTWQVKPTWNEKKKRSFSL